MSVVGRPNVGKSTLVNAMVGTKVSITSERPNTTRHRIRGVLHQAGAQVVFVDTPGIHRPRTALGERLNRAAADAFEDVDVVVAVFDATAPVGPGDRRVLHRALGASLRTGGGPSFVVAVNKVDRARRDQVLERLAEVAAAVDDLEDSLRPRAVQGSDVSIATNPLTSPTQARSRQVEYFPVSARDGRGLSPLLGDIVSRLPEGPPYYPEGVVTDLPEAVWIAELVREQLLWRVRDELPHSIGCRVTDWDWPHVRCEVVVERESQKAIIIGKGGKVLKEVGTAVGRRLPPRTYLELFVRVEKRWQQRDDVIDRLGY